MWSSVQLHTKKFSVSRAFSPMSPLLSLYTFFPLYSSIPYAHAIFLYLISFLSVIVPLSHGYLLNLILNYMYKSVN